MDSPRSEPFEKLALLRESARRGDWNAAERLAADLRRQTLPAGEELGLYLRSLQETLVVAKAARADAKTSLARLNAADRFNRSGRFGASLRQDFVSSADF